MKNVVEKLRNYPAYLAILFLVFGLSSCSEDDDGIVEVEPTGAIQVEDDQMIADNTVVVQSVVVGQDSWLVAVRSGEENSNNFITEPQMVSEGSASDIELTFNDNFSPDGDEDGTEISLILYEDNPTEGTMGEFDEFDEPIMDENDVLVTETITVFAQNTGEMAFSDFDENSDGTLDINEVPNIYADNFSEWDTDDNGSLNEDEFLSTTFNFTDADDDSGVDEDEWNMGFDTTFGNFVGDDFATFDSDADGVLDEEEWNSVFSESAWFGDFDTNDDAMLEETEFDEGLFGEWDTNDDDTIDEDEFNVFSPFVGMW